MKKTSKNYSGVFYSLILASILALMTIFSFNPIDANRQIRNGKRFTDIQRIKRAVNQFLALEDVDSIEDLGFIPNCNIDSIPFDSDNLNLTKLLDRQLLVRIPLDPIEKSPYEICQENGAGFRILAPKTEGSLLVQS
jgi:hypothetical protein